MADDPMPDPSFPDPSAAASSAPSPSEARPRRPVYEPSLLPTRTRRRLPRWVVIPVVLLLLGGGLYVVVGGGHTRRFVATAGTLVLASDQGSPGAPHLWRAALDGTGARRLLHGTLPETQPAFSPDGAQVAYVSPVGGNPQVFVADADGLNPQQVTRTVGAKLLPRFAPSDNSLLAYVSGGAVSTVGVVTGDASRLLPPAPDPSGKGQGDSLLNSPTVIIGEYQWAPGKDAGAQALAAREETSDVQALVVVPGLGAAPRDTQTTQPNSPPLAAADAMTLGWSPSGSLLAVALLGVKGLPGGRALSAIALFDKDGNPAGQRPLAATADAATGPQYPVFSPDGGRIAFELWQQRDLAHAHCLGVFVVAVDGGTPPLPVARGDAQQVQWTPDGQSLLFLRRRAGGGHDLWRVGADGTGLTRLSDGTADISAFAVSPQGRQP